MDGTGTELSPGESVALINLSNAYVGQYYKSLQPGCTMPHIKTDNREAVANKMKSLFGMLTAHD